MEKAVCPNCGKELFVDKYVNEKEAIMRCRHCSKKFKTTFDEKTFPSKINSFNWGAFLTGGLWCLFNGKIGLGIFMLVLALFQNLFFSIVIIAIGLYLGIKGNKLAWEGKQWKSVEQFEKVQDGWLTAGIAYVILCIGYLIILFAKIL